MAKDMTLLWGSGSPPCWRVMIVLEEKKLQGYNQKLLSFEKMEQKSKEVMDINPRGQVPTFKHGDRVLNESFAACLYLENQFKSQGNQLIPDSPAERARTYQLMFESQTLDPKIYDIIYYKHMVPEGERHDSAQKRHRDALRDELKLWEGYMPKAPSCCLVGNTFTMADVVVYPSIAYLFHFGLSEQRYPKMAAYYKGLKDRASIKVGYPPTWSQTLVEDNLKDI